MSIVTRILAPTLLLFSGAALAQECSSLDSLDWMLGDWKFEVETTVFTEHWERGPDGSLRGGAESVSTKTGEMFGHEILSLEPRSGDIYYVATVEHNDGPISFKLVSCSETDLVFENPEHDFPKRIKYSRVSENEMSAHITDMEGKGFDLYFERIDGTP